MSQKLPNQIPAPGRQPIWYRGFVNLPERLKEKAMAGYGVEQYRSLSGSVWYRERGDKEAADLKRIEREHHPDFSQSETEGES